MKTTSFSNMECPIAQTLERVGPWWSLLIIRDAMAGPRRFKDFQSTLGIAKNTLTSRLNELVDHGILERISTERSGAFKEYQLTAKGRDLGPTLIALKRWGDKWVLDAPSP